MPHQRTIWLIVVGAWIILALICRVLSRAPRPEGDWAIAWLIVVVYSKLLHRLKVIGRENIPKAKRESDGVSVSSEAIGVGPLIIVCNHTAGVDPLLVQAVCPFDMRWMMLREMMLPAFSRLWKWIGVIPVDLNGRDSTSLRAALRHLETGGVIGIFAEGGLEQPHRTINPYLPGVGLLALKSRAPILPVAIEGTPNCKRAYPSLFMPSHSVMRFLPVREYQGRGQSAADIAQALEAETAAALDWPRSSAKGADA